ncbi:group III truncated hemoglobin [Pedobacter sp. NJ-S-72]
MKADIRNLEDIIFFVDKFYEKVQQDELLGPIFAGAIQDWGPHLQQMYQFWNAALFGVPGFRGNPFAKHAPLAIDDLHFEQWLILFNETIDGDFEGEMASDAKNRAKLMAKMFLQRLSGMTGGSARTVV